MKHFYFSIRKLQWLAILVVLFNACQEDTITPEVYGTLTGQVLIDGTNAPLANAIVSTSPATSQTQTDAQGKFRFDSIKTGTYTVRGEISGYVSGVETVTISEGLESSVIILMKVKTTANTSPTAPENISPASGTTDLDINFTLHWTATDAEADPLTYDVYTFHSLQGPGILVASEITDTFLVLNNLKYGTTYFWQVVVNDGEAGPVYSEVWSFSTKPFPDHPFVFAKVNNGKYDVFAAQSGNSAIPQYQLSELPSSNYRPRISPVGNKIAFLNNNFINTQIYVMNRDGSDPTLVPAPVPVQGKDMFQIDFCWSPDGTKLLYMNQNRLYKINVDGSGFEQFAELPLGEEYVEVDWAPVTNKIAARTVGSQPYIGRILLYNSAGSLEQVLVPDLPGNIGGPAFSIDGSSILFTHDLDGLETPDGRQLNSHIFLKNIASGVETDLSINKPLGYNDLDPKFSPNGALVIFVETSNPPNSPKNINLMNAAGGGRVLMFSNAEMPDWR